MAPSPPASGPERVDLGFREEVSRLFELHFPRLFRTLDRASGDPELAADLSQEAFVRLFLRGSLPDAPEAWLITVSLNLMRNAKTGGQRRRRILQAVRPDDLQGDAPLSALDAAEARETRARVRIALDSLPERERHLLLLREEGYSYRDLSIALDLNEASVGTMLARSREAFKKSYGELIHDP